MFSFEHEKLDSQQYNFELQSYNNNFLWVTQPKGNDFQVEVLQNDEQGFKLLTSTLIKTNYGLRPNFIECSESGLYALVSFSDFHYKTGEVYIIELSERQKLACFEIKQLEKPLTSCTFEFEYNTEYSTNQLKESFDDSPEFLLGTSVGEVFAGELQKKKVHLQFLKSVRASTYMSFQGNDCNAIQTIKVLNVNNKSALTFPDMQYFYSEKQFDKLNITIVIIVCGIICEVFVQNTNNFSQLKLNESTSYEFHELENLAIGENLPLFQQFEVHYSCEKLEFFWLAESQVGKNLSLERIEFDCERIIESASRQAMLCYGLKEDEISKIDTIDNFPDNFESNYEQIEGIEQLKGTMLDVKSESAILGIFTTDYHLLVVCSNNIIVLNLISKEVVSVLPHEWSNQFSSYFALKQTQNRTENYAAFENCRVITTGFCFKDFPDLLVKKMQWPPYQLYQHYDVNLIALPLSLSLNQASDLVLLHTGDETVNLWQFYLQKEDFDNAMRFSKNEEQQNAIKKQQAEYCLQHNNGLLAAQLLAESDCNMIVQFQKLISTKKFDVCNWFIEQRLDKLFDDTALVRKPIEYEQEKMQQMDYETRCDYEEAIQHFDRCEKQRYLAVQLRIEALIVGINYFERNHERDNLDLHEFYGIVAKEKQAEVKMDSLVQTFKDTLIEFITKKSRFSDYILKNVLQNSLINANLDYIYALYCTQTNDADFTVKYYLQKKNYDQAVISLKLASDEQFLAYLDKLICEKPKECFSLLEYRIDKLKYQFKFNVLIPIIRQHMLQLHQYVVDFCKWLVFEFKVKNDFVLSFIYSSLAELSEEELLLMIVRQLLDDGQKVDFMQLLQISRSKKLINLQVDILYRLNRFEDALELQFKAFNTIEISAIRNIEQSAQDQIYFGPLEKVFESFQELSESLLKLELVEDVKALYLQLFSWYMNITIVQSAQVPESKQSQLLHQIRYRQLQRVFHLVETAPFLTQLDAIKQIPSFFSIQTTRQLTDELAQFNEAKADNIKLLIKQSAEILEQNQEQIQKEQQKVVSVYGKIGCCEFCKQPISQKQNEFVKAAGTIVFPCGHCWHASCCVKLHYEESRGATKELIKQWRQCEKMNTVFDKQEQVLEEVTKKCSECCDEAIDDCLDGI